MQAIAAMSGAPARVTREDVKAPAKTQEQSSMDEIVQAMKFADAHNLEVVVEKLQPGQGVPFYWRFVRLV